MKQLLNSLHGFQKYKAGLYHYEKNDNVILVGLYNVDPLFDGSDRLSMSVMSDNKLVLDVFKETEFVIAEGDRFTNQTFIDAFKPKVLKINGDGVAGRKMRGSGQTDRHIKSISTRVSNIQADMEFADSTECFNYLINAINKTGRHTEFGSRPRINQTKISF